MFSLFSFQFFPFYLKKLGILFTLAERASGKYLEKTFPKYKGEVSLLYFNIDC
jgi:hypothetical protein